MGKKVIQSLDNDLKGYGAIPVNDYNGLSAQLAENTQDSLWKGLNIKAPLGTNLTPAKGDGMTDDSAVFQAALNYLSATGGRTLLIPDGTYMILNPVMVPSHITIIGTSQNAIIQCKAGMIAYNEPFNLQNVTDVVIKNLTIDGNINNISGDPTTGVILLRVENATNVTIDNVVFQNDNHGAIYYNTVTNLKVLNCSFLNVDFCIATSGAGVSDYIWIENNYMNGHSASEPIAISIANYVVISNNTILNKPQSNGIQIMGCTKVSITGNKVYNMANCIYITQGTSNSTTYNNSDIVISNNDIELGTSLLYANYVTGLIVNGNKFKNGQFYFYNSSQITIDSNRFTTVSSGQYARIQLFNNVDSMIVSNNYANYYSSNNLLIFDKSSSLISNIIIHDNEMINGGFDVRQTATNVKIYNNYNNGALYFPAMWYNANYVVNALPIVSVDKPTRGYSAIGDKFISSSVNNGYMGGICTTAGYNVFGTWSAGGNKYQFENYLLSNGVVVLSVQTGVGTAEPLGITSANTFANPYVDNDVKYVYCGSPSQWKSWGTIGSVI